MKLIEINAFGTEHDRQVSIVRKLIKSGKLSALWKQMSEEAKEQKDKLSKDEEREILNDFTFIK